MWVTRSAVLLASLLTGPQAVAQEPQPDIQIIAQAYDRCMATYAVRSTRTAATDEEIFDQATQSCFALDGRLRAAISAQLPAAEATGVLQSMDAQAAPNFMAMLARIRSDRSRQADRAEAPAAPAQIRFDPTNPAHCEVALGIQAIIAETFSAGEAQDLRRRLAAAREQSAARYSPQDATAARKSVWPLMTDRSAIIGYVEACPT